MRAVANRCLVLRKCSGPGQKRYDLLTERLPEHNGASQLHAVIWHAGQFKGCFDADEAKARQRFEELKGGPFAAAVVDPNMWLRFAYSSVSHTFRQPPCHISLLSDAVYYWVRFAYAWRASELGSIVRVPFH